MMDMVGKLEFIFNNLNNGLSYAEAKNAALVALDMAYVGTALSSDFLDRYLLIKYSTLLLSSVSMIVSLYTFLPYIGEKLGSSIDSISRRYSKKSEAKDYILYTCIASYGIDDEGVNDFLADIRDAYELSTDNEFNRYCFDLCKEIIYNSKILLRKYKLFKVALRILIVALVFLTVVIVADTLGIPVFLAFLITVLVIAAIVIIDVYVMK